MIVEFIFLIFSLLGDEQRIKFGGVHKLHNFSVSRVVLMLV